MALIKYVENSRYVPHEADGAKMFRDGVPEEFVEDLREHVRRTGMPDTWLYHSHTKPPPNGPVPEIIADDIEVPASLRASAGKAPCPICCLAGPRYYRGMLALFREEGVLRCIGEECGAKIWGGHAFWDAKKALKRRRSQNQAFDFITANVKLILALRHGIEALSPRARALDEDKGRLVGAITKAKAREVARECLDNGDLGLFEERPVNVIQADGGARTEYQRFPVGAVPFRGGEALRYPDKRGATLLHRALQHLDAARCYGEEAILEMRESEFEWAASMLRDASSLASEGRDVCLESQALLAPSNLAALAEWAARSECPVDLPLREERFGRLRVGAGARQIILIARKPELEAPLPPLVRLKEL